MNLFTYLKRAITVIEQSLNGQFLEQFKTFLSVIVEATSDNNVPLGFAKRDFGILSNLGGSKLLSNRIFNQSALRWWASVMFLTLFTAFGTLAQTTTAKPDVSVKKIIDTQSPILGQDVTYTIKVRNDGAVKATSVALTDVLPNGVAFKTASVGGVGTVTNSTVSGITTVVWNIGEVPATATDLTLTIVATVVKRGLFFNVAEITSEVEADLDSTPNNHDINEDDQDAVCFSVAEYFYKGDEFKIGLPLGYTNINWTKKVGSGAPVAIISTTPGVSLNSTKDTLTVFDITAYTEFAFTATNKSCPVGGCCPAKFIYGLIGSIGDYVFKDVNKDGIQNAGDTPLAGIKVILYKANGVTKLDSAITDGSGKYLFDSLQTDNYKVKFILPSSSAFSPTGAGTPATDSDAGIDGFSAVIPIDVEATGKVKDNLDIDAGIKTDCNINSGTLATATPNLCLPTGGSFVLTATVATDPTVPTGYLVKYVLTKGTDLVIQQVSNAPTFTVTTTGEYRIHTLVYDGNSANANYLDLSVVVLGTTKASDVVSIVTTRNLCAALDVTGVKFNVNLIPNAPTIACGCTQKTICLGGEVTLTASGCAVGSSYVWSNGGSTSSITVSPKTNQTYVVYCQKDNCKSESSNAVEVKVITVDSPLLSASPSKICAGESTTLTAKGCGGVVEWQTSPKQTSPQITVTPTVSETYKAVCKEFDCVSPLASVDVIVTPTPNAPTIVSAKGEICPGETISLTAMNCNGQVKWSTGQETTTITVSPTITSTYTVTCKVNGCTSAPSTSYVLTVKPIAIPTIKTTDLIVCTGGTATLTAEGCTGRVTWYYGDKTLTGATIIVEPTTTTTYYATCSSISCNSDKSLPVTVQVVNPSPPIVSSGTSTICAGSTVELTATGCEGTVIWSDGQRGTVVTVKPSVSTSYTATCSIGSCVSASSLNRNITVTDFAKPTITADKLAICSGNSVTLTASGCNGTVKWSDGVTGSSRTVTPTADVKYTATCESSTCKSDVSNELAITVTVGAGIKTPTTKNLNNVCPSLTVDLASGVTSSLSAGSVFEYHTGVLPTSPLVSNPNAVGTGTYYVFEKTGTGCYSSPGVINTYINTDCQSVDCAKTPATASAGADATICAEKIYKLSGTFGGAATSIVWKTTGTGSFDNPLNPTATYRSSLADVLAGTVKLIITTNDPDGTGPCVAKADTMVLTIQGIKFKPLVAITGNLNACETDSVTLTANEGYAYMWFKVGTAAPIATTRSIVVKSSGEYFFKLVDPNKCCSIESDTAKVNFLAIPNAPTANSVKIDAGTTADLNKLVVSNLPTGATLVFKTGASSASTTVANPSAVGAGTYYAFYKSAQGCYSLSTKITVENKGLTETDLALLITANKQFIAKDDVVTFTIKITNNGPLVATNVVVDNILPKFLTFISGDPSQKGDTLRVTTASIPVGGSATYTYTAKVNKDTIISNTAKITKASPTDPILINNVSTVVLVPRTTCSINLAMAILDTAKVSDGVYNVTYRLIAKNVCKDTLKNVTLYNDLAKTFKTPVTYEIVGKPNTGLSTNLIINDLFSKTDTNLVKTGSYMLPNASDTLKYVVRVTLNGNKGPFVSTVTIAGKTTGNENLTAKAKETLRFDLPNTRIGLAKEVVTTALKNDSTTYWTVPYRIRIVNMGANAITKLSVKDSLDAIFTAKGAVIVGKPIVIVTRGLTVNKQYTGKGLFTDLLDPDLSTLAKGATATIDLIVRVNVANAPDLEKIFNNVAVGTATGTDKLIYKDISTDGTNPDTDGDKDPSNEKVATPVQLKGTQQALIGLALAVTDTVSLADSSCNVTLTMTAKNYGKDNLRNVLLYTNIQNTIGKQSLSWKLVGTPRLIRGNAKINSKFNGISDSTITKSDSSFLAVGDSIVIAYVVNIKGAFKDTIYTQAIAKARSAVDTLKLTSDISTNGLKPDTNKDGNPDEALPTPIICKNVLVLTTAFIPDGFSPNGDGINDAFKIQGMKSTELNELIIFNRWGGVVFASPDYQNDWIGQANQGIIAIGAGQGLPDGTYFYCFSRYAKGANGEKGDKVAPDRIKFITLIR